MTAVLRKLITTAAAAIIMTATTSLCASAANGSAATGASLPSYSSKTEINVVSGNHADPTGSRDSTSAIQEALDKAKTKATGSNRVVVKIPAGEYKITQSLKIYSNTQLVLDNDATIIKCFDYGCMIYNDGDGTGGYGASSNILIQGGTWDGNTDNYSGMDTFSNIRIAHANNIALRNIKVLNNKNGHHMEIGGVQALTIEGCRFSGYTGSIMKEAIQLDVMNSSELFVGHPPFDDTACDNVVIRNCTFSDIPRAIGSHSAVPGVYYTNISILDNNFSGITNICMVLYNYKHCTISGNTVSNSGAGITFNYMSDESFRHFFPPVNGLSWASYRIDGDADTVISNNNITTKKTSLQSKPYGIKLYGANVNGTSNYPGANYLISNVRVSSNTVNCADSALLMTNVYNSSVKDNIFSANTGTECTESNLVTLSYCYNNTITGNTVSGAVSSGLGLSEVSDITVKGNTFSSNGESGVKLSGASDTEVGGNSFSDNASGGIRIGSGCENVTCSKNVIKTCGPYGVKVTECGSGKDIKVKSNDISGVTKGIACVGGGRAYLSGNSFEAVSDKVYADADGLVTLLKPKNFSAEEITADRIKLTWNAIGEADGIYVYRRQAGSEEFAIIASVDSGSIFQDERLISGTNYFYKIVPYIEYGDYASETKASDVIAARTKINLESAFVECVSEAGFTSRPVTPGFRVIAGGAELTPGVDYDYSYSDNVYVGTAMITITGRGNYIGSAEHRFEITLGAPAVSDALKRGPEAIVSTKKRTYKVTAERAPTELLVKGDKITPAAQRTIDSITVRSVYRIHSDTAVWNRSGYELI